MTASRSVRSWSRWSKCPRQPPRHQLPHPRPLRSHPHPHPGLRLRRRPRRLPPPHHPRPHHHRSRRRPPNLNQSESRSPPWRRRRRGPDRCSTSSRPAPPTLPSSATAPGTAGAAAANARGPRRPPGATPSRRVRVRAVGRGPDDLPGRPLPRSGRRDRDGGERDDRRRRTQRDLDGGHHRVATRAARAAHGVALRRQPPGGRQPRSADRGLRTVSRRQPRRRPAAARDRPALVGDGGW